MGSGSLDELLERMAGAPGEKQGVAWPWAGPLLPRGGASGAVSNAWAAGRADVMSQSRGRDLGGSLEAKGGAPTQVAREFRKGTEAAVLGAEPGRGLCAALVGALTCFRVLVSAS